MLTWDELRGVVAHELAHVRNRDVLIGSVAAAIAMGITFAGPHGDVGFAAWWRPLRRRRWRQPHRRRWP